ncbi:superfamily II DNA and RNA helicase [Longilinea arvoryzae]|uniref:RNA helicase n=1 Tax=Longilinea arvoryzae TaxID=360412 RepID=A0A0S7BH03_9CHLR|nr:DEAD/DEAH box helicase [Longilinea arvoryzae]GAP12746.1 superfamily II DNA and RNA helicase [Longilinea arvoryzae]
MEENDYSTGNPPTSEPLNPAPQDVLPEARLADLPEKLRQGAALAGWSELLPVQAKAIPYLFSQRDMMIQSRTGSGKTGAYLLPMLELVNPLQNAAQVLILVPTRELALQVATEAELLGQTTGVRSIAVYGGVGYRAQLDAFKNGAQIVIGTPGRILDHLLRRSLSLRDLKYLIFDEADRMLSMGFYPDMRRVQSYLPDRPISTYMFSATFPPQVMRLTSQFLRDPGFINLSSDHIQVTETEHVYYNVPRMDKDRSLVRIIEVENPLSAIIFCNTKVRVEYVTTVLRRFGYDVDMLTSDLSQAAREAVLTRIRQGALRFLVATDVAARGIDLPELSHVIQYEPPEDPEAYIHRSGRTGRAGGSGTAITLVNVLERAELMRIAKRYSFTIEERPLPTDETVQQVVTERVITLLESRLRARDNLQAERMQRFIPLASSLAGNDEDGLLAMLLDDFYQETFYGPVVPPPSEDKPERRHDFRRSEARSGDESERRGGQSGHRGGGHKRRPR